MWSMLQSMLHPTALRSSHDRCLRRLSGGWLQSSSENGAPETKQVMRRAARKAIQQKEPLEEGTEEYQALLQEARDHHSECPVFKDPELGQLTVLNLYNPDKRFKAIPQEVGSKTKMAKHLFHNYL
ncbi:Protein CBG07272 [Caenorhabditis briggsae]|uniref:Protein CBG07272 n=1 Tax=Caenorhabditis briggsae TaxID=6238 RepID=A8X533_CAEBR|nr:Protein CBG07272 [Caenorhabditis briggsae]CAP27744.1 Protein CBG07272 [Caenorhabditis briggsae]